MTPKLNALRHRITNSDARLTEIREEILEIVSAMFSENDAFYFDEQQPLASKDGEEFAIETAEKDIDNSFVTGTNNDGREFYLPIDQMDTDKLMQLADCMCSLLEKKSV